VAYAAYKLTGEAKRWWQDKKAVLVADLGPELIQDTREKVRVIKERMSVAQSR
jgi:hypothetical protein